MGRSTSVCKSLNHILPVKGLVLVAIFFTVAGVGVRGVPAPASTYTTRYDHVDVDAILRSSRLLQRYMDCVLDKGPCTREGLVLKKHVPEAIQTGCAKCSPKQKEWSRKIMNHLLVNRRDYWNQVMDKYDPKGTFRRKYE